MDSLGEVRSVECAAVLIGTAPALSRGLIFLPKIEKNLANEYNPNKVAPPEMKLLYDSIKEDGYTMPIVCYYNADDDMYEIVDGFHRYQTMRDHKDIYEREHGMPKKPTKRH